MKLFNRVSYVDYERLKRENAELRENHTRLLRRIRDLENTATTLTLRVGMLGYSVEDVPARPATLALRKTR